jgi:hypothetical protein
MNIICKSLSVFFGFIDIINRETYGTSSTSFSKEELEKIRQGGLP